MTQFYKTGDKPIEFVVPASWQPADCLPIRYLTYADDARWLISTILTKTAVKDVDSWGCVRLHSDILRRVMRKSVQPAIVQALVDHQVIETAPHREGVRSKGFRISRRFLGDRCVRVRCQDPRLADRIQRERDRLEDQQQKLWCPVHYQLAQEQQGLSIAHGADAALFALPDHCRLPQSVLVDRLRRRIFSFTVRPTGRCFGAISNLKRVLRSHLLLHGEPIAGVDIVAFPTKFTSCLATGQNPPFRAKNAGDIQVSLPFPYPYSP